MTLWDSPRQRQAYTWFATQLANLRTAFRWAADHDDLDTAATIATFVGIIAFCADNYEPSVWAEELIEPARSQDHPRLAWLYLVASICYLTGRSERGVGYAEAIPIAKRDGCVDAAAVIASFAALNPMSVAAGPKLADTIAHIRENLGASAYETFARKGATLTPSAIAGYAYEQIDRARTELEQLR